MTSAINPIALTGILAALAALVLGISAVFARRTGERDVLGVFAFLCALPALYILTLFHPELVDPRFRVYKTFYNGIHG
ncbi:hypothetical protein ACXR0O_16275 [Verrucomicrobiota bacterium sgz303538]